MLERLDMKTVENGIWLVNISCDDSTVKYPIGNLLRKTEETASILFLLSWIQSITIALKFWISHWHSYRTTLSALMFSQLYASLLPLYYVLCTMHYSFIFKENAALSMVSHAENAILVSKVLFGMRLFIVLITAILVGNTWMTWIDILIVFILLRWLL